MAVRKIEASFEHVCDCCKTAETSTSPSRPAHWIDLHILRDAYDYQGHAVADGSLKLLLCLGCSDKGLKALNAAFDAIAKATSPGGEQ